MAGDWTGGGWYSLELTSSTGHALSIGFRVRDDTVDMWFQGRCQAVLDRLTFRLWLARDLGPYVVDDVMWTMTDAHTVALVIRESGWWLIPKASLTNLRDYV